MRHSSNTLYINQAIYQTHSAHGALMTTLFIKERLPGCIYGADLMGYNGIIYPISAYTSKRCIKPEKKLWFSARRSHDTPQKLPKPPTLSYFTSRYSGIQKPLYYGILIKTFWEGSAIWHGSTCPRECSNLTEWSIRLWWSLELFVSKLLQDTWIMQQIQNPTKLYPEYNPVEKLTKSDSW